MRIKKSGRMIFGVDLTREEQKAIDKEIERQLKEWDEKHDIEINALVLYILHEYFGFGMKRLLKFYDICTEEFRMLGKRYELENEEIWLCTKKLKDYGLDLTDLKRKD